MKTSAPRSFGHLPDGREASYFTLSNAGGVTVGISDFGATLASVKVPDRRGKLAEIVLGFDGVESYVKAADKYFGSTVGRFGNRIAGGKFRLGDLDCQLATNNTPGGVPCHLHGGPTGFQTRLWRVEEVRPDALTLIYHAADGEEGYPGALAVAVTYTLTSDNELCWSVTATTDAETVVNIVHHPYWNLSGGFSTTIDQHLLTLPASRYLPTDGGMIPTGKLAEVADGPMDFRIPQVVGRRLGEAFAPLITAGGYDHCWILDDWQPHGLARAARLEDPASGRVLEISSNQPGIQFYSGNALQGNVAGIAGGRYVRRAGLCLETEAFPDSPNQPTFPSTGLSPGETYRHRMVYKFFTV